MRARNSQRRAAVSDEREGSKAVDAYLARLPARVRVTLDKLRKVILAAAPQATQVISYQMPTFRHHGALLAFAAHTNHCSLYLMSHAAMAAQKHLLERYDTSGVTIRFTPDDPLPATLVKKLVKARLKQNLEHEASKRARLSQPRRATRGATRG